MPAHIKLTSVRFQRRVFLKATLGCIAPAGLLEAEPAITRPVVSEEACPLEVIEPSAADGRRGLAVLRKPPGPGRFPAVVWLHPGITAFSIERLKITARDLPGPSRFLAAGYVLVASTYRSRDVDLQTSTSLEDCLGVIRFLRRCPYIDHRSVTVFGCSGGGDLALEVAVRERVCAIIAEEPATILMSGMFNNNTSKKGEKYTPADAFYLLDEPKRYYTQEFQKILREKIRKIRCPILLLQGDLDRRQLPINRFNAHVLIPELLRARKQFTVSTHPGQGHCFFSGFGLPGSADRIPAPSSEAALKAFRDCDAFCRLHVRTQPRRIHASFVQETAEVTAH